MDGRRRQTRENGRDEKLVVKDNAHRRRSVPLLSSGERQPPAKTRNRDCIVLPSKTPTSLASTVVDDVLVDGITTCPQLTGELATERPKLHAHGQGDTRARLAIGQSDALLVMFYLDNLFPFLFPFYHPPLLEGGRAWILEMIICSPVVKQALLCQSSCFMSMAQGMTNWDMVLEQTRDAFKVLRLSLQVISDAGVTEHIHGTVRILSSIVQVQRFEVAVLSFDNCQAHLNVALSLFSQLLESTDDTNTACPSSSFNAVLIQLKPKIWSVSTSVFQVPIAEQAAFRFSSALLILDDIIAATILQEQPRLYSHHRSLL
jgi:hypothetical protein